MTPRDLALAVALGIFAGFIWVRDLSWRAAAADVLPILAGLPLFVWLAAPWPRRWQTGAISPGQMAACILLFVAGVAADLTSLLALSWCGLLWIWVNPSFPEERRSYLRQLLVLPLLSFPWIVLDGQAVGWAFRWSGAWATERIFQVLHQNAIRDGTQLWLNGQAVSVEPACSGLNCLQSLLLAGSALAVIFLGTGRRFWWNLPVLVVVAWLANTLRIVALCLAAVFISPQFFRGALHTSGGFMVLLAMFCLCWMTFALQRNRCLASAPRQDSL